eukprot:4182140-Amphidinium_carterae.1
MSMRTCVFHNRRVLTAVVVVTRCLFQGEPKSCAHIHSHLAEPSYGYIRGCTPPHGYICGYTPDVAETVMAQDHGRQPRFLICSAGLRNIGAVHPPRTDNSRQLEAFVRQRPRDRVHNNRNIEYAAQE